MKISEGTIFTAIGWILSGWAALGAFGYFMRQVSAGGSETPELVLIGMWMVLGTGGVFSYLGARLLRKRVLLAFPVAMTVIMLILFQIIPYVACSSGSCIPAMLYP